MKKIILNIEQILNFLLLSIFRNRITALIIILSVTVLALYSIRNIKVNPKWTNALPKSDSLVSEYLKLTEDPLRGSFVYAVIGGADKDKAADDFTSRLLKSENINFVFDGRKSKTIDDISLTHLDLIQLSTILEASQNINIYQLSDLYRKKLSQFIIQSDIIQAKAFSVNSNWTSLLREFANALENKPYLPPAEILESTFFNYGNRIYSLDNELLLLLAGTKISEGSIENLDETDAFFHNVKEETENKFKNIRIELTGYPISASDEMKIITTSGERMTILALVVITIFLGFFYGGWKFLTASISVLSIAIIITLAINRILFGELNTVTLILGLVLIGLGIDFCIHWINYRINKTNPLNNIVDDVDTWKTAATPILAGALTTAGAFLSLLVLNVQSLNEFGMMSSMGIVLTAFLVLTLTPLFTKRASLSTVYTKLQKKQFSLTSFIIANKKIILVISILCIIGSPLLIRNLEYEYNYAKLQTGGLSSYQLKEEIINEFGFASDVLIHRVKGIEKANVMKEKLSASEEIGFVLSVSDYLSSTKELTNKKLIIRKIEQSLNDIEIAEFEADYVSNLTATFIQLKKLLKIIQDEYELDNSVDETISTVSRIISALNDSKTKVINEFNREWVKTFRSKIRLVAQNNPDTNVYNDRNLLMFKTSQPDEYIQYIYPVKNTWHKENMKSLEVVLSDISPPVVGISRISWHMAQKVFKDIVIISFLASSFILLSLIVILRKAKFALLAQIPLLLGMLLTLSTLSFLNIKVSLYNLIGIPIIMGIGIDDGLHIVHAFRKNTDGGANSAMLKAGPAIFLTSITSMIGFGCLSFYTHPGISSLGTVTFIGVGWCFVSTLLFLPILLDFLSSKIKTNR
jgi:predicted RND superfamily exporter protein